MAVTKIWDVRGWLGKVILYVENPEKTENPEWSTGQQQGLLDVMDYAMADGKNRGLVDVLDYAQDGHKTEQQQYVSGVNCSAEIARQQMILTKKQWNKEGGIVAYHAYQSFRPGEVTPEEAHNIGVELAKRLWGERFEVVVATHLNTKCIHNHFVLNSVSFADGKRYYDNKATYGLLRRTSDEICRERGLSVIEGPKSKGKHYAEWRAEQQGGRTWRSAIREDVDRATLESITWSAFLRGLRDKGYEVKTGVKHMAVRPPGKERFVRLRSLGEGYTEEAIKKKILGQRTPARPQRQNRTVARRVRVHGNFRLYRVTWKSLRALYFFYVYKLREARGKPTAYIPYALREDLRYMDALSEQAKFLAAHRIDTVEQLAAYRREAEEKIAALGEEKRKLINERRRTGTTPERKAQIALQLAEIGGERKKYRQEAGLCREIAERTETIEKKGKERIEHVHTGRSSAASGRHGGERSHKGS